MRSSTNRLDSPTPIAGPLRGPGLPRNPDQAGVARRLLLAVAPVLSLLLLPACISEPGVTPIRSSFNQGVYHFQQGDYTAAASAYRQALRNDPDDTRARFNLAVVLEAQARRTAMGSERLALQDQAAELYAQLAAENASHTRAAVSLAVLKHESGQTDDALAQLESLIDAHPNDPTPATALAAVLIDTGNAAGARDTLLDARRLDPGSVTVNVLLGDAEMLANNPAAAATAYQTALNTQPDNRAALLALARAQLILGETADALGTARRLLILDPDNTPAHALAADAAETLNQPEAAVFHLWRVRDATTDPKTLARINNRLAGLYRGLLSELR
ncbi:MAG: tetratricopeptide repeat protein [Planctomycetota bacterium]